MIPSKSVYLALLGITLPANAQTLYSFGNPNADEQMYIEYINRARSDPPAEGLRLATTTDPEVAYHLASRGVDLTMMKAEFALIAPAPPLAPNAILTSIARSHSQYMLVNDSQTHNEQPGNISPTTRMANAGYTRVGGTAFENVYHQTSGPWYGHAGLNVDWGTGPGNMQTGRGHRNAIHTPIPNEIGVGIAYGTNGSAGPQGVTQDMAKHSSLPNFATGVAYYDLNGDNFYNQGEGIAGLTVNVSDASYYCLTADGGGWVVPVPTTAAVRQVTFTGLNINETRDISIPLATNAKLDLKLTYTPPSITSTGNAYNGLEKKVVFSPVAGASGYNVKRWTPIPAPTETADGTDVTSSTTGSYSIFNGGSFRLLNATPGDQFIELSDVYLASPGAVLSFQSRLRYSTTGERYKIQVREEGASEWIDVYSQTGYGNAGEASFNLRTASLSAVSGKMFRVRLRLEYIGGSFYPQTANEFGWFVDNIQFTNVQEMTGETTVTTTAPEANITPSGTGSSLVAVFPVVTGRSFPGGFQELQVAPAPAPGFENWAVTMELANSLPAGTILGKPNEDKDNDGLANLIEYAFATSPLSADLSSSRLPKAIPAQGGEVAMEYKVDTSLPGIVVTPLASTTMGSWVAPGEPGAPAGFAVQVVSTEGTIETRRATLPVAAGKGFMRVRVTTLPP